MTILQFLLIAVLIDILCGGYGFYAGWGLAPFGGLGTLLIVLFVVWFVWGRGPRGPVV